MTQNQRIVQYIEQFGSISTIQAFQDLGVTRLASRIHDLKAQGYNINTETGTSRNRYGEKVHYSIYSFAKENQ